MNKLGTALTVVFVVSLVALVAEILYVILRRRLFIRRSSLPAPNPGDVECMTGETSFHSPPSKDELLYFFCWKSAHASTRVEPDTEAAAVEAPTAHPLPTAPPDADDDVLKWHQMYGPSRVLFTIKEEEEKEETEAAHENNIDIVVEGVHVGSVLVLQVGDELEEATPFSTPCASPPYPSPSPS